MTADDGDADDGLSTSIMSWTDCFHWWHFGGGNRMNLVCINIDNLDLAECYNRVPSDKTISLFCSVDNVVRSLLNLPDPMLACLLSSLNHSLDTSTLSGKVNNSSLENPK
ncbi:hypothetical protein TKK_0006535 [Trichogramma kaykai]